MYPTTYVPGFHDDHAIQQMSYHRLGDTNLITSKIAFGASQVGDALGDPEKEYQMARTLKLAVQSGINYIDTAPYYGAGNSETMLGKALVGIPREAYYLATKVGRYTPHYDTMFDFSARRTLDSVDLSLKKMNLDCIDLIQVHDVEFASGLDIILTETLPALQKVKEQGKAKYIGVTGYCLDTLKELVERSPVHIDTVLSYSRHTLWDNSLDNFLPFFKERGVGLIHAAPLGMGLLTPQRPLPAWHPVSSDILQACDKALAYCQEQGVELPRLAAHHPLDCPDIDLHLIGMPRPEDVRSNLNLLYYGLSEKEKAVADELQERYFSKLEVTHWEGVEVTKYWKALRQ